MEILVAVVRNVERILNLNKEYLKSILLMEPNSNIKNQLNKIKFWIVTEILNTLNNLENSFIVWFLLLDIELCKILEWDKDKGWKKYWKPE